jgi:hypothetical protein
MPLATTGNPSVGDTLVLTQAGQKPTPGQLVEGQLAINVADNTMYTKDIDDSIDQLNSFNDPYAVYQVNGKLPQGTDQAVTLAASDVNAAPLVNNLVPLSYLPLQANGSFRYVGQWDASTNTPALGQKPASNTIGNFYVVSADGTQFGISWKKGDLIVAAGATSGAANDNSWQRQKTRSDVESVNGVTADETTGDVTVNVGVTSVDLQSGDTSVLKISGGPITSTGTLTIGFETIPAGQFLAGKGDNEPQFRALVSDDVPTIDEGTYA